MLPLSGTTLRFAVKLGLMLSALAAAIATPPSAMGQTIYLTATDANSATSTSFNTAGHWSNGLAPQATLAYSTSDYAVRSLNSSASSTFGGASLSIAPSGRFLMKATGTTQVDTVNLILAGGYADEAGTSTDGAVATLAGTVTVNATSALGALGDETLLVNSTITGGSPLQISGGVDNNANEAGITIFSSSNNYSGGTTVFAGTLDVANNAGLGAGPLLLSPASGTATVLFPTAAPMITSLASSGAGTSLIVLGSSTSASATTLTIGGNAATTYSGIISDLSKSNAAAVGSLVLNGGGTLTLSPTVANSFTGGTTVNQGTLILNFSNLGTNTGTVGGPLTINPGGTVVVTVPKGIGFANASPGVTTLSISGALLNYTGTSAQGYGVGGGQTVYLTGGTIETNGGVSNPAAQSFYRMSNAYLAGGSNTIYALSSTATSVMSGAIEVSNSGTFNVAAGGALLVSAGIFNNGGAIAEAGSGLLIFSGSNTYASATIINGGTLQLGAGGATGSLSPSAAAAITNNSTLAFSRSNTAAQGTDFSSAPITGTGNLVQMGPGLLVLNASNGYSGGTTVSGGTLQLGDGAVNNGSVSGNITNNATLVFANPSAQQFAATVSGTGNVVKTSAGILNVRGDLTFFAAHLFAAPAT
jgi:fibronectin-binding autotransporter adhesin